MHEYNEDIYIIYDTGRAFRCETYIFVCNARKDGFVCVARTGDEVQESI